MHVQHRRDRQVACLRPGRHANAQARTIHADARIHARHVHVHLQSWRANRELRALDLQLAETLEAIEWIGLGLARQAHDFPPTVGILHQGQQQVANLQFGERMPGQQARVHRHLQLRTADGQFSRALADMQVVKDETRSAPRPFAMRLGKTDRLADASAQPCSDLVRVSFHHRQQLVGDANHQRHHDQHDQHAVARPATRVSDPSAQGCRHY